MKKLPVGISTFKQMIEGDFVYVDKTHHLLSMTAGKYFFLSRPRRFGKSVVVDTAQELFEGNEKLFQGLHIHERWDWQTTYPGVETRLR